MTRAMILAAGRGERMGELTAGVPKPLLQVAGHYLIEYAIVQLKRAGVTEIVINVSHLAEQIQDALGNGARYGVNLLYSVEKERLETGGGILKALPLLGAAPFILLSADVICDYPLTQLPINTLKGLAHLVLVPNPLYHPQGDFGLANGYLNLTTKPAYTFANISVLHPDLFAAAEPGHFRLSKLLLPAVTQTQVTGELYTGQWFNVGTKEDLTAVNARAREDSNLRPLASETNTLSN